MRCFLFITICLSVGQFTNGQSSIEKLTGHWKLIKMQTPDMFYDLEHKDSTYKNLVKKMKVANTGQWTPQDSATAEMIYKIGIEAIEKMFLDLKDDKSYSINAGQISGTDSGKYLYDQTKSELTLIQNSTSKQNIKFKVGLVNDTTIELTPISENKLTSAFIYKKL